MSLDLTMILVNYRRICISFCFLFLYCVQRRRFGSNFFFNFLKLSSYEYQTKLRHQLSLIIDLLKTSEISVEVRIFTNTYLSSLLKISFSMIFSIFLFSDDLIFSTSCLLFCRYRFKYGREATETEKTEKN